MHGQLFAEESQVVMVAQESGWKSSGESTWSRNQDGVLFACVVVAGLYWESPVRAAQNLKDDEALHPDYLVRTRS
jgi:hypothetical protein